jgi:hypothetical protein
MGCNHNWERISEHADKGLLDKKYHPQHQCTECGETELCNSNESNDHWNGSAESNTEEFCVNQCSKCGKGCEGWGSSHTY